jgi:hypothetical protein
MLTTGDGIWIFIICVGIPIGFGIGYFGPLIVFGFYQWWAHKNDYKSPHPPSKYHQMVPYGASLEPISMRITLQPVGPREEKNAD